MRAWNPGSRFEFLALEVAFWRNGDASKDVLVEVGQRAPIFGDQICVSIFRTNIHSLSPITKWNQVAGFLI
jgi:hypothetical protein